MSQKQVWNTKHKDVSGECDGLVHMFSILYKAKLLIKHVLVSYISLVEMKVFKVYMDFQFKVIHAY